MAVTTTTAANIAQRMNRFDKVAFDTSAIDYPASGIVISRHREERVRLASLLIHRAIQSKTMPLQAVVVISSTPQFLLNELKQLLPTYLPLHIIASNEADYVMPVVVDYLVQFARMGYDTDGTERGKHHIITVFDCTEADASRLLHKSIFCRDLLLNGRHFDTSCIYLTSNVPVLPPDVRANLDYVFAFAEPLVEQRKSLYKYYFGVFDHLSEFNDCFERYVQSGDEALVMNNRVRSNNKWHMISMCAVPQVSAFFAECQISLLPVDFVDKDFIMGLSILIEKTLANHRTDIATSKSRGSKHAKSERQHRRKHHKRHRRHESNDDNGDEDSASTIDNDSNNAEQGEDESNNNATGAAENVDNITTTAISDDKKGNSVNKMQK